MVRCIAGSVGLTFAILKILRKARGNGGYIQCLERRIYERPLTSEPFIENQSEHISKLSLHQSLVKRKFITKRYRRAREPSRISLRFLRRLKNKSSVLKKFLFKRISSILIPKSSKLHRYVKKVRKLYNTRYKCNHKHDPKIFYLIKVTVPKKTSLLSLSSRLYHVIMKLKCKARRYLSLFSCNSESHMTNYLSFKLSTDVEKNPGPTQRNTDSHETIIKPVMQSDSSIMQLVSPVILMRSRLYELGLQAKDVGGAGDCFFRSVSHQLYGNSNDHMQVRIAGVQYMRDHPERFVESNTDNSWLRYLNDMCIQGTWSDALIVQAVADALNVVIHIVESNPGFSPITTVYPVQERNSLSTITIGHIDECHYVSTTPLQSNASISMYNKSTTDLQSSINKHFIMSIYAICFSIIKSCTYWDSSTLQALHEHACLFYEKCDRHSVSKMPSIVTIYGADIEIKFSQVIQSSLTQCYHVNKEFLVECILKENARSCVTPAGYLFCCNDIYISCIVHHSTSDTCYFVLTYENEQFCLSGPFNLNSLVKKVNDVYRLDDCISNGTQNISYSLFCPSAVSNEERKNIVRTFKSMQKKRDIYNKYNDHYSHLEPAKKKQRYSSMDRAKKDELLETCAKKCKEMDTSKKKQCLKNRRKHIN